MDDPDVLENYGSNRIMDWWHAYSIHLQTRALANCVIISRTWRTGNGPLESVIAWYKLHLYFGNIMNRLSPSTMVFDGRAKYLIIYEPSDISCRSYSDLDLWLHSVAMVFHVFSSVGHCGWVHLDDILFITTQRPAFLSMALKTVPELFMNSYGTSMTQSDTTSYHQIHLRTNVIDSWRGW